MREINEITGEIVDAAYHIHTRLGPGLLESVYEAILAHKLTEKGLTVERQKPIRLEFDGLLFKEAFRVDLLVEGRVLLELKSVDAITPVMPRQVLTYLRILDLPVGLLINFNTPVLNKGIHRVMNFHVGPP
jgi:iron complex transport system substrate-binding protein